MRFQQLAEIAERSFEIATRNPGTDAESTFVRVRDDAPAWVTEMMRDAAHDGASYLPDDYRYSMAQDACEIIAEYDDEDDVRDAAREWEPSPYTHDLTAWLHSRPSRVHYLDEALAEYGTVDGFQALAIAQQMEFSEVFDAVLEWLLDRAEEMDDDA